MWSYPLLSQNNREKQLAWVDNTHTVMISHVFIHHTHYTFTVLEGKSKLHYTNYFSKS